MDFLILALATFRISSLIADEDGPLGALEWLRSRIGVERDEGGQTYGTNNFAVGVICLWCNSLWIAITLVILYLWLGQMFIFICWPLALSTVTMVISRYING
jgi:hypothetical protein